ncbi:MAG: MFS transporter [Planctomycetaceae bacterium]|nr:MFS transporter [Planctomycetaceae bacterium]
MQPSGDESPDADFRNPPSAGASQKPTLYRYLVLILVAFASASAYLTRHALAAATTRIQSDMGIDSDEMGWVFSAFAMGYFISQVPAGWLATRLGSRLVFPAISILWSLASVWTSFVTGAWGITGMAASRFVFGNAQAGLVPISARVLRDWMPTTRRGVASALVGAAMSLGGFVTMAMTGRMLESGWSWRTIMQLYSLVGIVWAVVFYLVFRSRPQDHPAVNAAEVRLITAGPVAEDSPSAGPDKDSDATLTAETEELLATASPVEADEPLDSEDHSLAPAAGGGPSVTFAMLTSLAMWGICLQSFFRAAAYQLLVTFYPKFLSDGYGLSVTEAADASGYALLAVVIGSLLGGVLVDLVLQLFGNQWVSRTGTGFIALAGCGILTGMAGMGGSSQQVIILVTVGALFAGLGNPPAWAATMDVAGDRTAEVMGVMNMAGTAGGVVFPVILGYVIKDIETTGGNWDIVLWITAGTYLLGAASWLIVNPRRPLIEVA